MVSGRGGYRLLNGIVGVAAVATVIAVGWLAWRSHLNSAPDSLPPHIATARDETALAREAERAGRLKEAEAHLREALSVRPGSRSATLRLAEFYSDHAGNAEAVALYGRALGSEVSSRPLRSDEYDPVLRMGECNLALGKTDRARDAYRLILQGSNQGTQPSEINKLRSRALERTAFESFTLPYPRRRSLLTQALRLDARNWAVYRDLVALKWSEGRFIDRRPALHELALFRQRVESEKDSTGMVAYASALDANGSTQKGVDYLRRQGYEVGGIDRQILLTGIAEFQIREVYSLVTFGADGRYHTGKAIARLRTDLRKPNETDPVRLRREIAVLTKEEGRKPTFGGSGGAGNILLRP